MKGARDPDLPALARAAAPPLPPRDRWPAVWREAARERWCIAAEGGSLASAEAVAELDVRVAVARGDLPPLDAPDDGDAAVAPE